MYFDHQWDVTIAGDGLQIFKTYARHLWIVAARGLVRAEASRDTGPPSARSETPLVLT
jgi:hypothetical protein